MKIGFIFFISFFFMWLGGYLWYLTGLSSQRTESIEKTDAIVVLTGGQNRLKVAVDLLENNLANKLYISGVDEKVTRAELISLLGSSVELSECCIESGNRATDTVGNALETMEWVLRNDIKSLRLVTSLEHMPRAIVEFKRFMPNVILLENPVGLWRPSNINYFNLSQEYSKYIISLIRARITYQMNVEYS